jgi:hypothetical protein
MKGNERRDKRKTDLEDWDNIKNCRHGREDRDTGDESHPIELFVFLKMAIDDD